MNDSIKGGALAACLFLAAVVGAGFATGQEIFKFFVVFEKWGLLGILICSAGAFIVCRAALRLGHRIKASSFPVFLDAIGGYTFARIYHVIVTAFIFVVFGIMASGMGALFSEQLNLPPALGFSLYLAAMLLIIPFGEKGVTRFSAIFSPILIGGLFVISVYILLTADMPAFMQYAAVSPVPAAIYAFLYLGYNCLIGLSVICCIHKTVKDDSGANFGAFFIAFFLFLALCLLYVILFAFREMVAPFDLPLFPIITLMELPFFGFLYPSILIIAILTTGAACGFFLFLELGGKKFAPFMICSLAVPFAFFDFSFLVGNLYGFFGVLGLALCAVIVRADIKRQ